MLMPVVSASLSTKPFRITAALPCELQGLVPFLFDPLMGLVLWCIFCGVVFQNVEVLVLVRFLRLENGGVRGLLVWGSYSNLRANKIELTSTALFRLARKTEEPLRKAREDRI